MTCSSECHYSTADEASQMQLNCCNQLVNMCLYTCAAMRASGLPQPRALKMLTNQDALAKVT
jgi:hypothetical protein